MLPLMYPLRYGLSLSARRAWIEIQRRDFKALGLLGSLSARRAWIEILIDDYVRTVANGRSPQGERG